MNYSKYAEKAYSKISQYGSKCEIVRTIQSSVYNPATNEYEGDEVSFSGFALQSSIRQENVDGTNIKFGDIMLMCVFDESPMSNDVIRFGGKDYTVVSVSELNPNGNKSIYYKVQAR